VSKRTKKEIEEAHARCRVLLLANIRDGFERIKHMSLPDDVSTVDIRNVADSLAASGVLVKIGQRNAAYRLVDEDASGSAADPLPRASAVDTKDQDVFDTDGMTQPEAAFELMIRNMPKGVVGKVQAETPSAIVRRFSERHSVPFQYVDKLLAKAVREGRLTYDKRFEDGWRVFVWRP
jgi:hypothetical protein